MACASHVAPSLRTPRSNDKCLTDQTEPGQRWVTHAIPPALSRFLVCAPQCNSNVNSQISSALKRKTRSTPAVRYRNRAARLHDTMQILQLLLVSLECVPQLWTPCSGAPALCHAG